MKILKFLRSIGLTTRQAKIFLEISKEDLPMVNLAKRLEIPRSTLYLELSRMLDKGFIKTIKENYTTKYYPLTPEELKSSIVRKKN